MVPPETAFGRLPPGGATSGPAGSAVAACTAIESWQARRPMRKQHG